MEKKMETTGIIPFEAGRLLVHPGANPPWAGVSIPHAGIQTYSNDRLQFTFLLWL